MVLADASYKFNWVDIGANGSASDATVFNNSDLKDVIENKNIGFPEAVPQNHMMTKISPISSFVMTPSLLGHGS